MTHLTREQIEDYEEGRDRALDAHVSSCPRCTREVKLERRISRALAHMERYAPSPEFVTRLDRALGKLEPPAGRATADASFSPWMIVAATLASVLLLILAVETAIAFRDGGALDFVSLYLSQPDVFSSYPTEALSALVESLPLVEILLTLGLGVIVAALGQQFFASRSAGPRMRREGH